MKTKGITYTGILTLILGVVLIFLQSTAISVVVMVVGATFLLAALINIVMEFRRKARVESNGSDVSGESVSIISTLTAVATGALGLWMLLAPTGFSSLLVYAFAAIIILAGLYHICLLSFGFKGAHFPFAFYILPILMVIGGGVVLYLGPERMMNAIVLVMGIAMIVYAVCNFIEAAGESNYTKIESH